MFEPFSAHLQQSHGQGLRMQDKLPAADCGYLLPGFSEEALGAICHLSVCLWWAVPE
jgi:hypothetical protein